MSQLATLQAMDAAIAAGFAAAGMADAASYTPPGYNATVVTGITVLVDRAAQFFDDANGVAGTRTVITLYLAEVANPLRQGVITVGSESWNLDKELARDESMVQWVVVNV